MLANQRQFFNILNRLLGFAVFAIAAENCKDYKKYTATATNISLPLGF